MKKTKSLYWTFTIMFSLQVLFFAIPDLVVAKVATKNINGVLGYPLYFTPFIGLLTILGVIALLIPGYSKIKEWVYAGFAFDWIGAVYSSIARASVPTPWPFYVFMALLLTLYLLSYIYYHKKLKLIVPGKLKQKSKTTIATI